MEWREQFPFSVATANVKLVNELLAPTLAHFNSKMKLDKERVEKSEYGKKYNLQEKKK